MASINSLIWRFLRRLARLASSGEPRFRLLDFDEDEPKETKEEAADDEDVEQADGDVENGCDRMASEAFSCFLFSITREEGDKVGDIGAEDDDWAVSSGLTSSSVAVVAAAVVVYGPAPTLALELVLRGFSDFLNRITAAVDGPSVRPPSVLLGEVVASLASAPLM